MKLKSIVLLCLCAVVLISSCSEGNKNSENILLSEPVDEIQPYSSASDYNVIDEDKKVQFENSDSSIINEDKIVNVIAGSDYIIALTEKGKVLVEGNNDMGALATGNFEKFSQMKEIEFPEKIKLIDDLAAVGESNTIYIWGPAYYGDDVKRTGNCFPQNPLLTCSPEVYKIPFDKNIVYIHKSWDHINLLTDDGEVYTYGAYCKYDLTSEIPECCAGVNVYPTNEFVKVDFGEKIKQISCGAQHTVALGEGGKVYGYGSSFFGQLGKGEMNEETFCVIESGTDVAKVYCTGYNTYFITSDGKVKACGTISKNSETGYIDIDFPEKIIDAFPSRFFSSTFISESGKAYRLVSSDIYELDYTISEQSECEGIYIDKGIYKIDDEFYINKTFYNNMYAEEQFEEIIY